jgi:hypothetical protein
MCIWILISWNFGWFGQIWRCKNLGTKLYRFILNGTDMHNQLPYRFSINLHRRTPWRQAMSSVLSDQGDEAPIAGNTHRHESQHSGQKDSQRGITARPLKREFRSWYTCANLEDNLTMWISSNLNESCRMNLGLSSHAIQSQNRSNGPNKNKVDEKICVNLGADPKVQIEPNILNSIIN